MHACMHVCMHIEDSKNSYTINDVMAILSGYTVWLPAHAQEDPHNDTGNITPHIYSCCNNVHTPTCTKRLSRVTPKENGLEGLVT